MLRRISFVGQVRRVHPNWQYVLPLRNGFDVLIIGCVGLIAWLVGGVLTTWTHHVAITMGAVGGALPAFACNLPAMLRVEYQSYSSIPGSEIDEALTVLGWQRADGDLLRCRYVQSLPRFFRWQSAEICVEFRDQYAEIRGPVFGLSLLRKRLISGESDA